jgi:hypothetical protein
MNKENILISGVTSHLEVIDQSMINIFDMKKISQAKSSGFYIDFSAN